MRPGCGPSSSTCPARVHLQAQHGPPVGTIIQQHQGMRVPCTHVCPWHAQNGTAGVRQHAMGGHWASQTCRELEQQPGRLYKTITTSDQGTQRSVHFTAAPAANNPTSQSTHTHKETQCQPLACVQVIRQYCDCTLWKGAAQPPAPSTAIRLVCCCVHPACPKPHTHHQHSTHSSQICHSRTSLSA